MTATGPVCPVEIWDHIFSFACVDGGATGCSLSLVSRYIHEASARVRFQAVELLSFNAMEAFLIILNRTPRSHCSVRFLTILADKGDNVVTSTPSFGRAGIEISNPYSKTLIQILDLTAPTVVELDIGLQTVRRPPFPLLPPFSFPNLHRLFFAADDFTTSNPPPQEVIVEEEADKSLAVCPVAAPTCPSLREVKIVIGNGTTIGETPRDEDFTAHIFSVAPNLRRLSLCATSPVHVMSILGAEYWGRGGEEDALRGCSEKLPKSVEELAIETKGRWSEEWELFSMAAQLLTIQSRRLLFSKI